MIDNPDEETRFEADKRLRLRLPVAVAEMIYFWNYYSTPAGAKWGTRLICYLDKQVAKILVDLRAVLRDERSKRIVAEIPQDFHMPHPTLSPKVKGRPWSLGGMVPVGNEHNKLKNWVDDHPTEIGVCNFIDIEVEYQLESGDAADIVFELKGKRHAVVKVQTVDPLLGGYQVQKYKVHKYAQLGFDIKSSNVEPILVAWEIPPDVKRFSKQYGIRFVEKRM